MQEKLNISQGFTIPVLDHGFVRYLDHMGGDETVVAAARVSYHSESKGPEADQKLLHYLYKNKHTSPFEMVKISFNIKMPIFVMRQYVRHRMQNLNEVSARYTELPNQFYIPKAWRKQDGTNRQGSVAADNFGPDGDGGTIRSADLARMVNDHCNFTYSEYRHLLAMGVAREMARMILPVNIYTEIVCCWDMKNLLHFLTLRDDSHAQAEIQEYAKAMKTICRELFPLIMEAHDRFKFPMVDTADPHNDQFRTA